MATTKVFTLAKVLLAVLKISACRGFLFNGETLATLCFPRDRFCSCVNYPGNVVVIDVSCAAQNLTKFPDYTKISDKIIGYYLYWTIIMTDNELTTVPSGVFSRFSSVNRFETHIYLSFERNKISIIANDAFIGINNMDIGINLTDNRIAALPLAFQLLPHLNGLFLQGNPLLAFDSAIVNSMAKSLYYLELGYNALVSGNKELSVLHLTSISIYDIPSDYGNLTFNPFLFFRNTMTDVFIAGTDLVTLPCSLIDGPDMTYFYIQDASKISANNVSDCQPGTSLKVYDFEIVFSGLEEFPDILKFMPSLRGLNLFHNKISSINEKFIPLHNKLEVLNLSYNRLWTIPAVFGRFDRLKFLYLQYNQINVVAPEANVHSIVSVCAQGNPNWMHGALYCNYDYDIQFMAIDNDTVIIP